MSKTITIIDSKPRISLAYLFISITSVLFLQKREPSFQKSLLSENRIIFVGRVATFGSLKHLRNFIATFGRSLLSELYGSFVPHNTCGTPQIKSLWICQMKSSLQHMLIHTYTHCSRNLNEKLLCDNGNWHLNEPERLETLYGAQINTRKR